MRGWLRNMKEIKRCMWWGVTPAAVRAAPTSLVWDQMFGKRLNKGRRSEDAFVTSANCKKRFCAAHSSHSGYKLQLLWMLDVDYPLIVRIIFRGLQHFQTLLTFVQSQQTGRVKQHLERVQKHQKCLRCCFINTSYNVFFWRSNIIVSFCTGVVSFHPYLATTGLAHRLPCLQVTWLMLYSPIHNGVWQLFPELRGRYSDTHSILHVWGGIGHWRRIRSVWTIICPGTSPNSFHSLMYQNRAFYTFYTTFCLFRLFVFSKHTKLRTG